MKFLPLLLLLLSFISLNVQAYGTYAGTEEMGEEELLPEDSEQVEISEDEASLPQPSQDVATEENYPTYTEQSFNEAQVSDRLNNEMSYLNSEADKQSTPIVSAEAVPGKSAAVSAANATKVQDLEEKINFRAAAVKREDNLAPDEVDASELDGDLFKNGF